MQPTTMTDIEKMTRKRLTRHLLPILRLMMRMK